MMAMINLFARNTRIVQTFVMLNLAGCSVAIPEYGMNLRPLDELNKKTVKIVTAPQDDREITTNMRATAVDIIALVADAKLKCVDYEKKVQDSESKRKDSVTKAKQIAGSLTGGIAALTGAGAAAGSFLDSKGAAIGLNLGTIGVGVLGSIITAIIEPGTALSATTKQNIAAINADAKAIDEILNKPNWWNDDNQVNQLRTIHIPNLVGRCSNP